MTVKFFPCDACVVCGPCADQLIVVSTPIYECVPLTCSTFSSTATDEMLHYFSPAAAGFSGPISGVFFEFTPIGGGYADTVPGSSAAYLFGTESASVTSCLPMGVLVAGAWYAQYADTHEITLITFIDQYGDGHAFSKAKENCTTQTGATKPDGEHFPSVPGTGVIVSQEGAPTLGFAAGAAPTPPPYAVGCPLDLPVKQKYDCSSGASENLLYELGDGELAAWASTAAGGVISSSDITGVSLDATPMSHGTYYVTEEVSGTCSGGTPKTGWWLETTLLLPTSVLVYHTAAGVPSPVGGAVGASCDHRLCPSDAGDYYFVSTSATALPPDIVGCTTVTGTTPAPLGAQFYGNRLTPDPSLTCEAQSPAGLTGFGATVTVTPTGAKIPRYWASRVLDLGKTQVSVLNLDLPACGGGAVSVQVTLTLTMHVTKPACSSTATVVVGGSCEMLWIEGCCPGAYSVGCPATDFGGGVEIDVGDCTTAKFAWAVTFTPIKSSVTNCSTNSYPIDAFNVGFQFKSGSNIMTVTLCD